MTSEIGQLPHIREALLPSMSPPRWKVEVMPVLRPKLPTTTEIFPYLRAIDERRWYSNWGPLVKQLEQKLSSHLGLTTGGIVTTANATAGLTVALLALEVPRDSLCLMPSWTFSATAHAARAAGLCPWFHDVDRQTWALDPGAVLETLKNIPQPVGAVIVVSPFGAPVDVAAWQAFEDRTGVRVIIDAAAAFDTAKASRIPVVVSLHATKILPAGEGGFVATTNTQLRDRMIACCNFGFNGSRSAILPALNAKMSEYHAAVGLASFANWTTTRARHAQIMEWYRAAVAGQSPKVSLQPGYGEGWAASTTSVILPPGMAADTERALMQKEIEVRAWWGQGCHVQPAFADCPRGPLPITEDLGARVVGLPHFLGMGQRDVDRVAQRLAEALGPLSQN